MMMSHGMEKNRLVVFWLAAIVFLSLAGCRTRENAKKETVVALPVKVMKVERKDLQELLEYVGDIKAQDEAEVFPKVSGKVIEKVKEEGSVVKKGEAIAYIDRDEVGLKYEKAPVESPLAGVVGRVVVDIGSHVTPQTAIALVVDMEKVKIDLEIPEQYLPRVTLGQEAKISVDAYPDEVFSGKVAKISPVLDEATRTAPVEITVDNQDHRLKSGMFARVNLVIEEHKNVPVILKEALIGREPNLYVYAVENNRAVLKNISVDIRQDAYVGIKEGIKEGDRVVIVGQQRLYEGAEVAAEE